MSHVRGGRTVVAVVASLFAACGGSPGSSSLEGQIQECIAKQRPDIPKPCSDAYLQVRRDELEKLDASATKLGVVAEQVELYCAAFIDAFDEVVKYSSDEQDPRKPSLTQTEVCVKVATYEPAAPGKPAAAPLATDDDYPCGESDGRIVLCAQATPFPAGDRLTLAAAMTGAIPLADPMHHYQYGFVFDSDDQPANNYQAPPAFPNDFFHATDRWYVAVYSPETGWAIEVSNASDTITPIASDARIVIEGSTMMLIVPAAELGVAAPPYRVTAFAHLGDFGLDPPHVWSADVEPAVALPLERTWITLPALPASE